MVSDCKAGWITRAAEALASSQSAEAVSLLVWALGDSRPVVREGAILGLEGHVRGPRGDEVRELIHQHSVHDRSPGVRQAARDALADSEPSGSEGG